jgi:hypothetical protein
MRRLLFWFGIVAIPLTTIARGDGLLHRLPEDGTWVKYQFRGELGDNTVNGSLWMGSVGQVTMEGKRCRWIEVRMEQPTMQRPIGYSFKVLVPTKYLKEERSPFGHIVQGWYRKRDREPVALDSNWQPSWWLWIALAPSLKQVKELEPKLISTKLGKLSCPGRAGIAEYQEKSEFTFETYLHHEAPFGVVRCSIRTEMKSDREMAIVFELNDFGDKAKSEFLEPR